MVRKVEKPRRVIARKDRNYRAIHRPSRWGNPFPISQFGREKSLDLYSGWLDQTLKQDPGFLEPLRGYNLGCFCPLGLPCHADIILSRLYKKT